MYPGGILGGGSRGGISGPQKTPRRPGMFHQRVQIISSVFLPRRRALQVYGVSIWLDFEGPSRKSVWLPQDSQVGIPRVVPERMPVRYPRGCPQGIPRPPPGTTSMVPPGYLSGYPWGTLVSISTVTHGLPWVCSLGGCTPPVSTLYPSVSLCITFVISLTAKCGGLSSGGWAWRPPK